MVLAKLKNRSLLSNRRADCTKYKYDVFGNRIEQIVDADGAGAGASVTTRFAWEGAGVLQDAWGNRTAPVGTENWNIWADLNGSNGLVTRYVRGDEVDQLFSRVKADGTVAHYLTDRMQSTRQMLDASGTVANTITYDGFGNVLSETDAAFGDRWKWTGRENNAYTGLQYNRARYYSGESGRWVSEDPIGFAAGDYNRNRYAFGFSTGAIDPSGLDVAIVPSKPMQDGNGKPVQIPGTGRVPAHGSIVIWDPGTGKGVVIDGIGPNNMQGINGTIQPGEKPKINPITVRPPAKPGGNPVFKHPIYNSDVEITNDDRITSPQKPADDIAMAETLLKVMKQIPEYNAPGVSNPNSNTFAAQVICLLQLTLSKKNKYPGHNHYYPGIDYNGENKYDGKKYDEFGDPRKQP